MKQTVICVFVCFFASFGILPLVGGQSLSPNEKRIVDFIDQHNAEAISLLEKVVNIESPTEDLAGVKNVGMVFGKEFEALGMSVKWIDLPPEMKPAGHLFAETSGKRGKHVLLLGHLDTVLAEKSFGVTGTRPMALA